MEEVKKTLVIYAHPQTKGHCSYFLQEVEAYFKDKSKDYTLLDLYALSYDPVLKASEHYTSGNREISGDTKKYQDLIAESNYIIFIFPVWWGQMPAILKGFIDRVLTPGFAYKFKKLIGSIYVPDGFFKDKRTVLFITSGTPRWQYLIGVSASPVRVIKKMILNVIGIKYKIYVLCGAQKFDATSEHKIKSMANNGLSWLYQK